MKTKQILAAILAAMMASAALSGCGDGGESSQSTASTQSGAAASSGETEEFTGYPIETDETITMWNPQVATLHSSYTSYTESPFHMGLEEKTGVKVDWQFPLRVRPAARPRGTAMLHPSPRTRW